MTQKKPKGSRSSARKSKKLSLSKQTLKDLGVPGQGPKGGTLMGSMQGCAVTQRCGAPGPKPPGPTGGTLSNLCYIGSF
jgi:hypothetical protein